MKTSKLNVDDSIEKFDPKNPTKELVRRLAESAEPRYRDFVAKFLPPQSVLFGVRIPLLREIARKIVRENGEEFLNATLFRETPISVANRSQFESCEERVAVGFIVAETPFDFDRRLDAVAAFIPLIDSWLVCDIFCAALKIPKENRADYWDFLEAFAESSRPFDLRFAVVSTLNRFIDKTYLNAVFERVDRIAARRLEERCVDMALAWLLTNAFVKFPDATLEFMREGELDDFTFNKTLQKICDSRRVDAATKEEIRRLKRPRRKK